MLGGEETHSQGGLADPTPTVATERQSTETAHGDEAESMLANSGNNANGKKRKQPSDEYQLRNEVATRRRMLESRVSFGDARLDKDTEPEILEVANEDDDEALRGLGVSARNVATLETEVVQEMAIKDARDQVQAAKAAKDALESEWQQASRELEIARQKSSRSKAESALVVERLALKKVEKIESRLDKAKNKLQKAQQYAEEVGSKTWKQNREQGSEVKLVSMNVDGESQAKQQYSAEAPRPMDGESRKEFLIRTGKLMPFDREDIATLPEDHRYAIDVGGTVFVPASAVDHDNIQEGRGNLAEAEDHSVEANEDSDKPDIVLDGGLRIRRDSWERLFEYQQSGVRWLWELHRQQSGGIIGDEMGLGKTVQICSFLGALSYSGILVNCKTLVVAPVTMINTWAREIRTWAPSLSIHISHNTLRAKQKAGSESSSDDSDEEISLDEPLENPHDEEEYLQDSLETTKNPGLRMTPRGKQPRQSPAQVETSSRLAPKAIREAEFTDADIIITSYDNIRRREQFFLGCCWTYVVLDEGHKIRNPDAKITVTCKQLNTPHRIILSGSPLQNRLRELWSLFDFVFPGKLGTLPVFEAQFAVPISLGSYTSATPTQAHVAYHCAKTLKQLIDPYLLRRVKKDVALHLPKKTEHIIFCRLTPVQRQLYEVYVHSKMVENVLNETGNLLAAVTELRKICNHPSLAEIAQRFLRDNAKPKDYFRKASRLKSSSARRKASMYNDDEGNVSQSDGDDLSELGSGSDRNEEMLAIRYMPVEEEWKQSGKMLVLEKVLRVWHERGHKVLLFSQTRIMLDILERFVSYQKYRFLRMDGTTPINKRMMIIDSFNHPDSQIFMLLLTTKVGGLGINLTGADRVIIFDPDWNPSTDLQARERAWRIGQSKPVTVFRLVVGGTIEEKMYHRQVYKQFISMKVLSDPKQRRIFKHKNMRELFALGKDSDNATETGILFSGAVDEVRPSRHHAQKPFDAVPDNSCVHADSDIRSLNTAGVHSIPLKQLAGRVDGKDVVGGAESESRNHESDAENGDTGILRTLFDGHGKNERGVHSVIDHDQVLRSAMPGCAVDLAVLEYEAVRIAKEAAEKLRESRDLIEQFTDPRSRPTFTGLSGVDPEKLKQRKPKLRLGSAKLPGAMSSGESILEHIQKKSQGPYLQRNARTDKAASSAASAPVGSGHVELMSAIIHFLRSRGGKASTRDLISSYRNGGLRDHSGAGHSFDITVFKALLKQVAKLRKDEGNAIGGGVWILNPGLASTAK